MTDCIRKTSEEIKHWIDTDNRNQINKIIQSPLPTREDPLIQPLLVPETQEIIQESEKTVFGSYTPMSSPGKLTIDFQQHLNIAQHILIESYLNPAFKSGQNLLAAIQDLLSWLTYASMNITYNHELFHHYCEIIQNIHIFTRMPDPEESMAVAFSLSKFVAPDYPDYLSREQKSELKHTFLDERVFRYKPPYDKNDCFRNQRGDFKYHKVLSYIFATSQVNATLVTELLEKLFSKMGPLHVEVEIEV